MKQETSVLGIDIAKRVFHAVGMDNRVAYLQAADIVSRPLPIRLRDVNQPVSITRNRFSRPHPRLLTCIGAH